MSRENNNSLFIAGMILGSAIGTLTGLILAPRTGKETREIIRKGADALPELAEDLSTSVQFQTARLSEGALRNWDDTLNRLKQAIAAGIEASKLEASKLESQSFTETDDSPNS